MALQSSHARRRSQSPWNFAAGCDQAIHTKNTISAPASVSAPGSSNHPHRKRAPSKWDDAEKWLICYDNPSLNYIDRLPSALPFGNGNDAGSSISLGKGSQSARDLAIKNLSGRIPKERTGGSMERGTGRRKSEMKDVGIEVSPSLSCSRDMGTQVTPFPRFAAKSLNSTALSTPQAKPKELRSPMHRRHCNTPIERSSTTATETATSHHHSFLLGFKTSSNLLDPSQYLEPDETDPVAKLGLLSGPDTFRSVPISSGPARLDGNFASNSCERKEAEKTTNRSTNAAFYQCSCCKMRHGGLAWEEGELAKLDSKYHQQEAKINAWVNLKRAKANAELRKLELKLERLRSQAMERAMKKVTRAHVKAEEMRKVIEAHHERQLRKVTQKETEPPPPKCFGSVLCIQNLTKWS